MENHYRIACLFLLLTALTTFFSIVPYSLAESSEFSEINLSIIAQDVKLKITEIGSVETEVKLEALSPIDLEGFNGILLLTLSIPNFESIDESRISVVDLHNPDRTFVKVVQLNPPNCEGKYEFNHSTKDIRYCIKSTDESDVITKINYAYNPISKEIWDACALEGRVYREVNFTFPFSIKPYKASYELSADNTLNFSSVKKCADDWNYIAVENGFRCSNDTLIVPNESVYVELNAPLSAYSKTFIETQIQNEETYKQKVKNTISTLYGIAGSVIFVLSFITKDFQDKIKTWGRRKRNKVILILSILIVIAFYVYFQVWW